MPPDTSALTSRAHLIIGPVVAPHEVADNDGGAAADALAAVHQHLAACADGLLNVVEAIVEDAEDVLRGSVCAVCLGG